MAEKKSVGLTFERMSLAESNRSDFDILHDRLSSSAACNRLDNYEYLIFALAQGSKKKVIDLKGYEKLTEAHKHTEKTTRITLV